MENRKSEGKETVLGLVDLTVASRVERRYGSYRSNPLLSVRCAGGAVGWIEIHAGKIFRKLGELPPEERWEYCPPTDRHIQILETIEEDIVLIGERIYFRKDGSLILRAS